MSSSLRVVIVDDSHFMRGVIQRALEKEGLQVVGTAGDGKQAVEVVARLKPDVVTMDVNMPVMDGVSAVREIMARSPTRIVMLSAHTRAGAEATLEALEAGAVDFMEKPSGEVSVDFAVVGPALVEKLRHAATAQIVRRAPLRPATIRGRKETLRPGDIASGTLSPRRMSTMEFDRSGSRIIGIAVSTGGPAALSRIIPALPGDMRSPVLIVQHMPSEFTAALAERLNAESSLYVKEAKAGEPILPGTALIAPGGLHLEVDDRMRCQLQDGPEENGCRPSADVMFRSLARVYGDRVLGVVLTGMGRDGASGLSAVKSRGGSTIAQDEGTSVVFGMPRAAIDLGVVDKVLPLQVIPDELAEWG